MHITTNRLHSAAATAAAIAASANFVSVLQSNEAEFQREAAAAAAFFTADFSLSLSLSRLLRCVRRTMAAHFADCSLRFSPPSLLVYQSASVVRVRPSQMKSVDQMAADAVLVCCTEVVMRAVQWCK